MYFKIKRFQGGHVFPHNPGRSLTRKSAVSNHEFDKEQTKQILKRCKKEGCTITQVVFVLCNIAWIRTYPHLENSNASPKMPMMMYSSLNHRLKTPCMTPGASKSSSYIALSYYNIVLPSFFPQDLHTQSKVFWKRCRDVKDQTHKFATNKLFGLRSQVMNQERAVRAMRFAREDDEQVGIATASAGSNAHPTTTPPSLTPYFIGSGRSDPPPPSVVLMGISTVNNLDAIYNRKHYPDLELTTLHIGTRKARGGILLYAYTFNDELRLSLGWDRGVLRNDVVERFWLEMKTAVEQYLLDTPSPKL